MAALASMANPGMRKIAVTSGQKTGKSKDLAVMALWFYECFEGARALMTAAIGDQIRSVLWKELYVTRDDAPHRPDGNMSEDPARGLVSSDKKREIKGFTGRTIEAIAGYSGNLLYLIDEASHLEQPKFEALKGNTAGEGDLGAPIVFTSQPTRNEGPFYDAFHTKKSEWTTMVFDAEKIAAYQDKHRIAIKGMATVARLAEWKRDDGEDSPFYQMRVRGAFLRNETGKIVAMHYIVAAQAAWSSAPEEGRLQIGIDPAGEGARGDEWAFSLVRGKKQIAKFEFRGISKEEALRHLKGFVFTYRSAEEIPWVVIDSEGPIGHEFFLLVHDEAERLKASRPAESFEAFSVKASGTAKRQAALYDKKRDEMWANLAQWLKAGGAIVADAKLEADLHCPDWIAQVNGKLKATSKDDMRERLHGRSPDRADALSLSVWNPAPWLDAEEPAPPPPARPDAPPLFDPYRPAADPYAMLQESMGRR
jgi:hypothetical protein